MDAVEKAEALATSEGLSDLLGDVKIFDILLAHEIFHAVEFRKENTIYTKTERVELWRKPFSNKSRLVSSVSARWPVWHLQRNCLSFRFLPTCSMFF